MNQPKPQQAITAQRLRKLHELVARRANTHWGASHIEDELAQTPDSPGAHCPRFAGIVEESGDESVLLDDTEADLARDMAWRFISEIPIRPVELVDLDTGQCRTAVCEATVRFLSLTPPRRDTPERRPGTPRRPNASTRSSVRVDLSDHDE